MAPSASAPLRAFALRYRFFARTQAELEAARAPLRAAHLEHAQRAVAAQQLIIAGACGLPALELRVEGGKCVPPAAPEGDVRMESLLILSSIEDARAFAAADPYVTGGIVDSLSVRPWTVVVAAADALR